MLKRFGDRPVIIGIVGDSGAGKTTLAAGLAHVLGPERTLTICIDDYHRYSRKERAVNGLTPHDPACNYLDILEQHVHLLRAGQPILKPVYNHNGGVLEAPEYIEPREFIVLEGLLGYTTPQLRDAYHLKFYLGPQESLRLRWKFQRDIAASAYTREQIIASMDKVQRDSDRYVTPQRSYADMVVSFYPDEDDPDEAGAGLNVAHILRPTLPYLDLDPLLQASGDRGLFLELARDVDGRPVDSLHYRSKGVSADDLEEFLWAQVPGAPTPRPRLGLFRDADNREQRSPALALSQLLITHYLLNAALEQPVS